MINLLPENEKKEIYREYSFRRLSVIFISIFFLAIFVAVFLLPSFAMSEFKMREAETEAVFVNEKVASSNSDLAAQIEISKRMADILKPELYELPSTVINLVTKHKTPNNKITSVSYSRDANGGISFLVNGVVKTRQGLVIFTDSLKKEKTIGKVDVPVSNFTKDSNINFSFTITIPKK